MLNQRQPYRVGVGIGIGINFHDDREMITRNVGYGPFTLL
jgi:hypothetical protein